MWESETLIPSSTCWFSLVWPFAGRTQAPHMTFNPTKRPTAEQLITPKHRDVKYRREACLMGQWRHINSLRSCIHFTWGMETEDGPGIDIHFRCSALNTGLNRVQIVWRAKHKAQSNQMNKYHITYANVSCFCRLWCWLQNCN